MKEINLGQGEKKLGFGFMRLPHNGDVVDMDQLKEMIDQYLKRGFTYFDTAYNYHDGKSECYLKEALIDRYPRESFQVTSKLPMFLINKPEEMEECFNTTMERTGAGYLDFYLLHALNATTAKNCEDFGAWEFGKKLKAEGKIKHLGFSFHDKPEVLEDILSKHHEECEFVQLQINYLDWDSEDVASKTCYEIAAKYNMPVIVMEPVKGGTLASVAPSAEALLKGYNKDASVPSWAIRYCASFENVFMVLSGMSNLEQLNDNMDTMENFVPLNADENKVIDQVIEEISKIPTVPCTDCKYCVPGCPVKINIPGLFKALNQHKKFSADGSTTASIGMYEEAIKDGVKASACISCKKCEKVCPQHIEITKELAEIVKIYE